MMLRHALLVLPVVLAACTPASQRQDLATRLSVFVGRGEADLVREMGVPSRSYETGGSRFLAYASTTTTVYPGYYGGYGGWGWRGPYYGGWGAPEVIRNTCEATFELRNQRILGVAVRGNGC